MCGIFGITSSYSVSAKEDLMALLQRLEYRGYDSCGFATDVGGYERYVGKLSEHLPAMADEQLRTGIAHTRWATHGGAVVKNTHPHTNEDRTISVVHNGIIENFEELKGELQYAGYTFLSETDTEVIPHFFDYYLAQGKTMDEIIRLFFEKAIGTYAVLVMYEAKNILYAFKKDSPMVIGIGEDQHFVASDVYAFINRTTDVVFLEDKEYAIITPSSFRLFNEDGVAVLRQHVQVQPEVEQQRDNYEHMMIKEIKEQPRVAQRLLTSLNTDQHENVVQATQLIDDARNVYIVACGTSHHAGMVARSLLTQHGYNVTSVIASEFDAINDVDGDTVGIAISQSGETMDTLLVLKQMKERGAKILALTNVPYSTIERLSDISINILAGQEVAVASTKAFTNQLLAMLTIIGHLAHSTGILNHLQSIPERIEETIMDHEGKCRQIARVVAQHEHVFFLGRRSSFPIALEMALKLKEVSYIHAEGQMAGELKHGSIALIDPDAQTPVFILAPNNDPHMLSSAQEVRARGANTIVLSNREDADIVLSAAEGIEFPIYASVIGQLLSYHTALVLHRDIDQPRNLAKSVTVG